MRLLQMFWQVFNIVAVLYIAFVIVRYFNKNGKK